MRLQVVYDIGLDADLDNKIIEALEKLGFKWYAHGFNIETGKRDIAFFSKKEGQP